MNLSRGQGFTQQFCWIVTSFDFVALSPPTTNDYAEGPHALGAGRRQAPDRPCRNCSRNHRILRRTVNTAPNIASIKPAAPVIGSKLAVRGSTRVGAG